MRKLRVARQEESVCFARRNDVPKLLQSAAHKEHGVTGLETAIILIAFVVVASVFAYTVLSAGIFSAQKGQEAIYQGLLQTRSSMTMIGGLTLKDTDSDDKVDELWFTVSNALNGEAVDLTNTTDADSDGVLDDETTKNHVAIMTYEDSNQRVEDIAWTSTPLARGDTDFLLEVGERFLIRVDLAKIDSGANPLQRYDTFSVEFSPDTGSALVIERTVPASVDEVMILR
jgi:flagellin FlaB